MNLGFRVLVLDLRAAGLRLGLLVRMLTPEEERKAKALFCTVTHSLYQVFPTRGKSYNKKEIKQNVKIITDGTFGYPFNARSRDLLNHMPQEMREKNHYVRILNHRRRNP